MEKEEFVTGIKKAVSDTMVDDIKYTFENIKLDNFPKKKEMANWFNHLGFAEKEIVINLIKEVSEKSIFGTLCVLDGVRTIEDAEDKGSFELYFIKDDKRTLINTEKGEYLHELFDFS